MNISDKLSKVNESFEVSRIDNGYMVEVRGRTHDDTWDGVRIYASTLAMVENLLDEWNGMERD
jgi:hypothetical protein